jgi:hypothetical protein
MINLHDIARELNEDPVVEPTPVETLYRRAATLKRRSLMARVGSGALAVGAVVIVAFALAATRSNDDRVVTESRPAPQPKQPASAIGWPTDFVSTRLAPDHNGVIVAVSDARTGALRKTITEIRSSDGTNVTGTAITSDGHVWVTLTRGPKLGSGVAGGDPQAHTCASEVRDYNPGNGRFTTVLRGGDDELISDAQPSPTGDRVAYLHSGCATYFFDNSVQVKNLANGSVVDIGANLPRCHLIDDPRWTKDGSAIAFIYAPAAAPDYSGPEGTCGDIGPASIRLVSAQTSATSVNGEVSPDAGCSLDAVSVSGTGYAGIEHCGPPSFISGAVRLVRYDSELRPLSRVALGTCEDGASIAGTSRSSDVIVSMYQFCGGNALPPPTTNVFVDGDAGLRRLLAIPGGETAIDHVSFAGSQASARVIERYHGVEAALPHPLARSDHATVSDCDALARPGVYSGQLSVGKCEIKVNADLLSVTFSPIDDETTHLSTQHLSYMTMKLVPSRGVAVGVWYGSERKADATSVLASVRAT